MASIKVDDSIIRDLGRQFKDELPYVGQSTDREVFVIWLRRAIQQYRNKIVQQKVDTTAQEAAGDVVSAAVATADSERDAVDAARATAVSNMEAAVEAGVS